MTTQTKSRAAPRGKTARIPIRTTDDQKAFFQRAAALTGRDLSDFMVSSAQEVATRTIREHQSIVLSAHDAQTFVELLMNPAGPNDALRAAAQRHKAALDRT